MDKSPFFYSTAIFHLLEVIVANINESIIMHKMLYMICEFIGV